MISLLPPIGFTFPVPRVDQRVLRPQSQTRFDSPVIPGTTRPSLPFEQPQLQSFNIRTADTVYSQVRDVENITPGLKHSGENSDTILEVSSTKKLGKGTYNPSERQWQLDSVNLPRNVGLLHKATTSPSRVRQIALANPFRTTKLSLINNTPSNARVGTSQVKLLSEGTGVSKKVQSAGHNDTLLEPFPILTSKEETSSIKHEEDGSHNRHVVFPRPFRARLPGSFYLQHRQRSSDASSAFVHTIKTASMSNGSLSIEPRSIRMERSSESHGCFRGYSRHSLDSDRPSAESPMDDAASRRGIKRRDIINELIMTEESYVADLKALVFLYSTLLASATNISDRTKTAIQRNVTELLHTHESLLEKLHEATFKQAARRWAATELPTQLKSTYYTGPKDIVGRTICRGLAAKHDRIRSSIDSADVTKAHMTIGAADPTDIIDLVEVLNPITTQLFAYEEYCANHKLIAHELQKLAPSLWATYQSGLESLNRSLIALNRRGQQDRKAMSVGDLLIKPIQRICRYPLLLDDLLKNTPVIDGPTAHKALDHTLLQFREVVRTVNIATDNPVTRHQTQRKWLLQDRLCLRKDTLSYDQFRLLGSIQLCGVLHLTHQDAASDVIGGYVACVLFDNHILIALPAVRSSALELFALISLSDLSIEAATADKGLQYSRSPYTWRTVFTAENNLHEILFSACSTIEKEQWLRGLSGQFRPTHFLQIATLFDQSKTFKKIRSLGQASHLFTPLSQKSHKPYIDLSSDQAGTHHVIIRNTYNPQDLHEWRNAGPLTVDRSPSLPTACAVVVLSPKRAERTRLESSMSDIYTRDRLPFPGMIASKGGQIIRASAGSLARKLSFASMQASISRRSASLSSKKSYHTVHTIPKDPPSFSVRNRSTGCQTPNRNGRLQELPELDTMESVVDRMIGGGPGAKRLSFSGGEKLVRKNTRRYKPDSTNASQVGPEDPASVFYKDDGLVEVIEKQMQGILAKDNEHGVEFGLVGNDRKRWSNPFTKLKGLGSDGIRNMLYSSK